MTSWWKFWESRPGRAHEKPDYYAEGVQLTRQERYHDALTSFRLALKEKPADVPTIEQMAVVYTRIGLPYEAERMYESALELSPGSAAAHYGLAFVMLNRGEPEPAAKHLERFLEADKPAGSQVDQRVDHARATLERIRAETAEGTK